jgi:hypothetical protein
VRAWVDEIDDRLPLQELLGGQVRADRAFLALPKYVGFFESFLKYEPAAATDMPADRRSSFDAAYLLPSR